MTARKSTADGTTRTGPRVVLITGAGSGIGAATAIAFADRGWTVYATDVETPLPAAVADRCRTRQLDVTDAEQCQAVVEAIIAETGHIDALVNNAGYAVSGPVEDVPVEEVRDEFDVLVHGVHRLVRLVLPGMRERGEGRIINVSSVLGLSAYQGLGGYAAGKAAVEALTDSLRLELRGTGVGVALVEPAWVDTDFAATATEQLADRDRTDDYDRTYAGLEDGWVLDGGPLAAKPGTVASITVDAATAESPAARYPVGRFGRFIRWTHWLPASIQDPMRRAFGRGSVTVQRLRKRFGRKENKRPQAASDLALSTGHTVSLPLVTEASIAGATLSAAVEPVRDLLPPGLAPVRVSPSRAAVTMLCIQYDRIGDDAMEPYDEFGILFPATPGDGTPPLYSPLTQSVGAYVWKLPVTTEPARVLGVEGWGYPKSVADIDIDDRGGWRRTDVRANGEHVCSITIKRPPTVPASVSTHSYTDSEGTLRREPLDLDGRSGAVPLTDKVSLSLGGHRWADRLRALDLGSRAVARVGFEGEFRIHPWERVETDG